MAKSETVPVTRERFDVLNGDGPTRDRATYTHSNGNTVSIVSLNGYGQKATDFDYTLTNNRGEQLRHVRASDDIVTVTERGQTTRIEERALADSLVATWEKVKKGGINPSEIGEIETGVMKAVVRKEALEQATARYEANLKEAIQKAQCGIANLDKLAEYCQKTPGSGHAPASAEPARGNAR